MTDTNEATARDPRAFQLKRLVDARRVANLIALAQLSGVDPHDFAEATTRQSLKASYRALDGILHEIDYEDRAAGLRTLIRYSFPQFTDAEIEEKVAAQLQLEFDA